MVMVMVMSAIPKFKKKKFRENLFVKNGKLEKRKIKKFSQRTLTLTNFL